ncbi:hypothetical protein BE221DRAFT_77363 [Ostreococcus tauri]|uniref:Uncharacterized protein n=1 Tax=Ostreococcus tauri TaxID=70448 RepID=A0A1Y5IDM2_OSTTA|nr:hypothetical protein BE221DRAFT_77363 [Ostreococcus tauri]
MHGYLTLAVIGAFTPETYSTGWTGVDNALRDDLARSALPTLIPGTIAFVYFNWLAARHSRNRRKQTLNFFFVRTSRRGSLASAGRWTFVSSRGFDAHIWLRQI